MKKTSKKAFSLVELIVVVVIIGILSGVAYIGIQKAKSKTMNDKVLDDVIGIANALERYNQDHFGKYPVPKTTDEDPNSNMNISCFYADATYAHDCASSAFRQGMIDNNLLTRRYMPEVPTDPRTGSRYVYGVSTDGKYFMVGGIYEESSGSFVAKTAGNLKKGYHLPSLIRAFNGPNFVTEDGTNLPYSPDHLIITATLQNMSDSNAVQVKNAEGTLIEEVNPGQKVYTGYEIFSNGSTLDIYFSDGSVSNLTQGSQLKIMEGTEVEENDEDGIITKIRIKLTSGKIWNKVARLASASEFNVETTTAIAGVRGTEFGVDVTENQVLLKSGEICRMNLVEDIPVGEIKDCSGTHAIDELTIDEGDDPKIIIMNAGSGTDSDTPTTEPLKTLMDEQSKRYLNDNIRPHILKVEEGGVITVANLRTYYDLPVGVDLEVMGLAALDESEISFGNLSPIAGDEDYVLTLTSVPTTPIVLRYIGLNGPDSGNSIPITITADTNLTEEDLYAVDEEVGEGVAEEAIGCTAADMIIAGDATFAPGSVDTKDVTLVWSVTPVECFEGATYSGEAGPEGGTLTSLTITSGSMQSSLGEIGNGSEYEWNITAFVGTDTYSYPASDTVLFTVPAGDVYCGNSLVDGEEECDNSHESTPGCISIGADACKCNEDLGWTPVAGGGCECVNSISTDDDRIITLPNLTGTNAIPINAALTWIAEPICAFEDAIYNVEIGTTTPITINSLTDSLLPLTHSSILGSLVPGETYTWEVTATDVVDSADITISSLFEVECPSTGTIALTIPADNATMVSTDLLTTSFEWDPADPECYFDSSAPYAFEIWLDGTIPSKITSCDVIIPVTSASSVTLTTTCVDDLAEGAYIWKVIRDNSSGTSETYERNFEITAPVTTFEPITSQTYYAVNDAIGFNIAEFDPADVTVTGGTWNSSAKTFITDTPGTYTLTGGGIEINLTVCGYAGAGGSECWVLGDELQNCDNACSVKVGLVCNDDPPIWEDTGSAICTAMTGVTANASYSMAYSPLAIYSKTSSIFIQCQYNENTSAPTACGAAPNSDISSYDARVCKCVTP